MRNKRETGAYNRNVSRTTALMYGKSSMPSKSRSFPPLFCLASMTSARSRSCTSGFKASKWKVRPREPDAIGKYMGDHKRR